jgi:hypothetical protein
LQASFEFDTFLEAIKRGQALKVAEDILAPLLIVVLDGDTFIGPTKGTVR